jgi:hypothetical protein
MKNCLLYFLLCITSTLTWAHPAISTLPAGMNIGEFNSRNSAALSQRNTLSQNTISSSLNQHSLQNVGSTQAIAFQNNRLIHDARLNSIRASNLLEIKKPASTQNILRNNLPSQISNFNSLVLPRPLTSNTQGFIFVRSGSIPVKPFAE